MVYDTVCCVDFHRAFEHTTSEFKPKPALQRFSTHKQHINISKPKQEEEEKKRTRLYIKFSIYSTVCSMLVIFVYIILIRWADVVEDRKRKKLLVESKRKPERETERELEETKLL